LDERLKIFKENLYRAVSYLQLNICVSCRLLTTDVSVFQSRKSASLKACDTTMSEEAVVSLSRTMSIRSTCVCALFLIFFTSSIAVGFNLNLRHALVFSDPTRQTGSYFGFTVALRKHGLRRW